MALFEINQRFKGHFVNKLHVSFNENETSLAVGSFLDEQKCKNIKDKICFKSVKRSYIDLILTSRSILHQFTNIFETGVSDNHLFHLHNT